MTDVTARPETLYNGQRDLDAKRPGESDQVAKWSWRNTISRFWTVTEETGEMDTRSFNGLL